MEPAPAAPEEREVLSVLLVEDNALDIRMVQEALTESARVRFQVQVADRLTAAVARVARDAFDVIILDLTLPDGWGLDSFVKLHAVAGDIPIVVLTGLDDETLGVMAVQQGAQEYLVKSQATGALIVRSVRYAVQRHRMQQDLRGLSLTDELTGLFNRRGFTILARQLLKLCHRMSRPLVLLFAELENLQAINASSGLPAGDDALRQAANLLRRTFRDSDVLARLHGPSFTILAIDTPHDQPITARLEETLKDYNALRASGEPKLTLGISALRFAPEASVSIDDLLQQADRLRGGGPREAPPQVRGPNTLEPGG